MSDMTKAEPTRFEPRASEVSEPFWDATREKRLLVQWCDSCDDSIFFPREVCPSCLGTELSWREASGRGTVYAVSVQHAPGNPLMASRVPYAVALVDLPEGIRIMTNIVTDDPSSIGVDDEVEVVWEPLSDGRNLPVFGPVS